MKIFQENESVDLQLVMFSQNRNQPILTDFRGYFPHARDAKFMIEMID